MNRFDILFDRPLPPEPPKKEPVSSRVGPHEKCIICGKILCEHLRPPTPSELGIAAALWDIQAMHGINWDHRGLR